MFTKFQIKRLCLILIMLFSSNFCGAETYNEKWKVFYSEHQKFEFKYPDNYTIINRKPKEFNINGLEQVLDIMKGRQLILRILIKRTDKSYKAHFDFIRRVSKSFKEILINNVPAIQYITCVSAACSWYIVIINDKKEIDIVPFVYTTTEGPVDKKYPLRSIVCSLRFEQWKER